MNTPQLGPRDVEIEDVVIVTGGMGFIGSLVADAFLARGRRVVIIDSLVSSVIPTEPREAEPNCTVLKMSVDDDFLDGGSLAGAERVIHAASLVGPAGILQFAGRFGADIVRLCASGELIYNIGNPYDKISMRDLAERVKQMTDSSEVIYDLSALDRVPVVSPTPTTRRWAAPASWPDWPTKGSRSGSSSWPSTGFTSIPPWRRCGP